MIILFIALLMGALYIGQLTLYRKLWCKGLQIKLRFSTEQIHAGDQMKLYEEIENRKWLPLSSLKVKFQCSRYLHFQDAENSTVTDKYYRNDFFSIMPYKRITRTHQIECKHRGFYGIYDIDLVGADLFFSEEMMGNQCANTEVYVIPAMLNKEQIYPVLQRINGEIAINRFDFPDPFTYRGIREYEVFDEMKNINWKASAKTGELKVNMRENTVVNHVRIFMNLQDTGILRREELLEMSISLCAGIAAQLLAAGIRVHLYANTRDCITGQMLQMEGLSDILAMDTVNKALARLDVDASTERFKSCFQEKLADPFGSTYTIFISPDRHRDYQEILSSYTGPFLWICPVKRPEEEKVEEALQSKVLFIVEESI